MTACSEKYETVVEAFRRFYGNDKILVDSSKYLFALEDIRQIPMIDLRVIFLLRDVRSWTVSQRTVTKERKDQQRRRRFQTRGIITDASGRIYKNPFFLFLLWWRSNRRNLNYLEEKGIPFMTEGYENLVTSPEFSLTNMCNYLEIPFSDDMTQPMNSKSHSICGNRMRFDQNKLKSIQYDSRWFNRSDWIAPMTILPFVMRFNSKYVYNKSANNTWSR